MKTVIVVSMISIFMAGCAAFTSYGSLERKGRASYYSGDFDDAVFKAVNSLSIYPEYEPAQVLLQDAFKASTDMHQSNLDQLQKSENKFKWDQIVAEYRALIAVHSSVGNHLPIKTKTGDVIELETKDYSEKLETSLQYAAEAHYQEGMTLSISEDLNLNKQSAKEFKIAATFVPGYRDSAERYEEMRKLAILRMAIFFEDLSGTRMKHGAVTVTIMDRVISSILNDPTVTEFLELISRDQLENAIREQALSQSGITEQSTAIEAGKMLGVHQILTGKITQIIHSPAQTSSTIRKMTKKVVVGTKKYTDAEGEEKTEKIYGDVKAEVKIFKRSTSATIHGSYSIVDVNTLKIIKSDTFQESSAASAQWARFKGDERALSWEQQRLARNSNQQLPVASVMVTQAAGKLSNSLANSVKEYAR